MNIDELKDRKALLEQELHTTVTGILERFHKDTGLTARSVDVQMVEITRIEDNNPRYLPSWVRCEIAI